MSKPMYDANGRSLCLPGEERYEEYYSVILKRDICAYDYRTPEGRLFACIAADLDAARKKCGRWMEEHDPKTRSSVAAA